MLVIANENFKIALVTELNDIKKNMLKFIKDRNYQQKNKHFYKKPSGNSKTEIYNVWVKKNYWTDLTAEERVGQFED